MNKLLIIGLLGWYAFMMKTTFEKGVKRASDNFRARYEILQAEDYRGDFVAFGVLMALVWPVYKIYLLLHNKQQKSGYIDRLISHKSEASK